MSPQRILSNPKECAMNSDQVKGAVKDVAGKVQKAVGDGKDAQRKRP